MSKKVDLSLSSESQEQFEKNLAQITHTQKRATLGIRPFFLRFSQMINIPYYDYFFPIIFFYGQNIVTSMWLQLRPGGNEKSLQILQTFFFFNYLENAQTEYLSGIVICAVSCFCAVWTMGCCFFFMYNGKISSWAIYLMAFEDVLCIPIMTPQCSFVLGRNLMHCFTNFNVQYLGMAIFAGISLALAFFEQWIYVNRTTHTVFMTRSPFAMWETKSYFLSYTVTIIMIFFGNFVQPFNVALHYVFVILHALNQIGLLYMHTKLEIISPLANAIAFGFQAASIIGDIQFLMPPIFLALFLAPIVGGIVISIIVYFINKKRIQKIMENDSPKTQEERVLQLRLAFHTYSPKFVDGSLIEQALNANLDNYHLIRVAHLCSYFGKFDSFLLTMIDKLEKSSTLNNNDTYLLYTINFASNARQSLLVSDEMQNLRISTSRLTQSLRSFWLGMTDNHKLPSGFETYYDISRQLVECNTGWGQEIAKYPLNAIVAQSYAVHLIENECAFEDSTILLYKANQLQLGFTFDFDFITITLLQSYPQYASEVLKNVKISTMDDLDLKKREESLQPLLSNVKLRLEFERAIHHKTSKCIPLFYAINFFRFFFALTVWVVVSIIFLGSHTSRVTHLSYICNISDTQVATSASMAALNMHYGQENSLIPSPDDFLNNINAVNESYETGLINLSKSWLETTFDFINIGRESQQEIVLSLIKMVTPSSPLTSVLGTMHNRNLTMLIMNNLLPVTFLKLDLREMVVLYFSFAREMTMFGTEDFSQMDIFYEMPMMVSEISRVEIDLLHSLCADEASKDESNWTIYRYALLIIGLAMILVYIPITIALHIYFHKELNTFIRLCHSLPERAKLDAADKLIINPEKVTSDEEFKNRITKRSASSTAFSILPCVINVTLTIIMIALLILMLIPLRSTMKRLTALAEILSSAGERVSSLISSLSYAICAAMVAGSNRVWYLSLMSNSLTSLSAAHANVLKFNYESSNLATEKIKQLQSESKCPIDSGSTDLHSRYKCQAIDQSVITYLELGRRAATSISDGFTLTETFLHMFHLVSNHLYEPLREILDLFIEYGYNISSDFDDNTIFMMVAVYALTIVVTIADIIFVKRFKDIYHTAINLVLRLDPISVLENAELTSYLLGKSSIKNEKSSSTASRILMNSSHPIVFVNSQHVVMGINSSFQSSLGFDPSHIIGMPITKFVKDKAAIDLICKQINEHSTEETTVQAICKKENGGHMNTEITFLNVTSETGEDSFALVISDKAEQMKLAQKAEMFAQANEELKKTILPPFLREKPNIEIPSAAVILIKFSNFTLNAAPADICKFCTDIWKMIESTMKLYPSITKISISDGIMCAVSGSAEENDQNANVMNAYKFLSACFLKFIEIVVAGSLSASIEIGRDTQVMKVECNQKQNIILTGTAFNDAFKLLQFGSQGKIAVGINAYPTLGQLNGLVEEQRNDVIRKFYLFTPDGAE